MLPFIRAIHAHRRIQTGVDTARSAKFGGLLIGLALLAIALTPGCATSRQRYDVQLVDGRVLRSVIKPRLDKDGFYFVKDASGTSGTINKALVRKIVDVQAEESKKDTKSFTSGTAKSAKPSGKSNFRDSFEFR